MMLAVHKQNPRRDEEWGALEAVRAKALRHFLTHRRSSFSVLPMGAFLWGQWAERFEYMILVLVTSLKAGNDYFIFSVSNVRTGNFTEQWPSEDLVLLGEREASVSRVEGDR